MKFVQLTGLNDEEISVVAEHVQIVGDAFAHTPSSIDPSKTVASKVGTMIGLIGQQVVVKESREDVIAAMQGPTLN